jgi:hypothetical protein
MSARVQSVPIPNASVRRYDCVRINWGSVGRQEWVGRARLNTYGLVRLFDCVNDNVSRMFTGQ